MAKSLQLVSIVLGLALSGCSTPAPAPAPPPPAPAPVSFDGEYSGTIQITAKAPEAGQSLCDTPPRFFVSVKNNAFTYVMAHPDVPGFTKTFQATIGSNGSFYAQTTNGTASMTGQITAAHMTGQISGEGCDYSFAAQHA